jgi:hypothetical protein
MAPKMHYGNREHQGWKPRGERWGMGKTRNARGEDGEDEFTWVTGSVTSVLALPNLHLCRHHLPLSYYWKHTNVTKLRLVLEKPKQGSDPKYQHNQRPTTEELPRGLLKHPEMHPKNYNHNVGISLVTTHGNYFVPHR